MAGDVVDIDLGWAALRRGLQGVAGEGFAKAGVLGEGKPRDPVSGQLEAPPSNVDLAVIHEFGVPGVPERSFMRAPFDANREKYLQTLEKLVRAIYEGKLTVKRALDLVGAQSAQDMRDAIRAGIPPPNSPATIARKGSSKPLIDTGQLIGAVTNATKLGPASDGET